MDPWGRFVSVVGGRGTLLTLGALYVGVGIGWIFVELERATPMSNALILSFFIAGPGLILLYGGYRLPRTGINPKFYSTITGWCLGAIGLLTGLLALYHVQPAASIDNPGRAIFIITGFVVVPAFAGGMNAAKAKTRTFELEQHNQELQEVRAQLEDTVNQLQAANEQLERSNERLEQFAYAASHDLQEPLRMVSSYLQLIEERGNDDLSEETKEFLEYAVDGADRMREMINALLGYSRVETQGEPLEPVDLNEVVADVRDDLDLQIIESDAEVTIEELPRVEGDESQLRQVFQNLLKNAIQYSGEEPPRVRISAERNSAMWKVSVRDEGIGIDPAQQERIFEVFQRLHSRSDQPGSGIGLALCERIVERHGGEIWVDSEPGEGSTFSFTLQAVQDQDDRRRPNQPT